MLPLLLPTPPTLLAAAAIVAMLTLSLMPCCK